MLLAKSSNILVGKNLIMVPVRSSVSQHLFPLYVFKIYFVQFLISPIYVTLSAHIIHSGFKRCNNICLRMRAMKISFSASLHLCATSCPKRTKASYAILFSNTLNSYIISLTLRTFSILTALNNNHISSAVDWFLFQVSKN